MKPNISRQDLQLGGIIDLSHFQFSYSWQDFDRN